MARGHWAITIELELFTRTAPLVDKQQCLHAVTQSLSRCQSLVSLLEGPRLLHCAFTGMQSCRSDKSVSNRAASLLLFVATLRVLTRSKAAPGGAGVAGELTVEPALQAHPHHSRLQLTTPTTPPLVSRTSRLLQGTLHLRLSCQGRPSPSPHVTTLQ